MLIKDKLLLENLTRKYGKDFVINEMTRGRKSKYTPSELYDMVRIPNYYFKNRNDLTKIVIPNNIKSIGEGAFYGCGSLTSVTIPDSVTSIGKCAFCNCYNLASVNIPNRVTVIENSTFSDCYNLRSIAIPDSITSIGKYAFFNCKSLTSVTIPDSVTEIIYMAFYHCNNLTSVKIPDSVTFLGEDAFPKHVKIIRKKVVKSNIDVTKKERDTRYNNNPLNIERNRKRDSLNKWIPSDDNSYGNYDKWFEKLDIETLEVITGYDYEEYEEENLTKEDFYEDCLDWWDKLNDRKKERIYNKVNKFLKKNDNSSNSYSSNGFNYNYKTSVDGLKYRIIGDRTYTYLGSEKDYDKWNAARTYIADTLYKNTERTPKKYPCEIVTETGIKVKGGADFRCIYYYFNYE